MLCSCWASVDRLVGLNVDGVQCCGPCERRCVILGYADAVVVAGGELGAADLPHVRELAWAVCACDGLAVDQGRDNGSVFRFGCEPTSELVAAGTQRPSGHGDDVTGRTRGGGAVRCFGSRVRDRHRRPRSHLGRGGRPIGVLGTGISQVYPEVNRGLHERVAAAGALVSQFWPGCPPDKHTFALRNATMAGLSAASVIVEAGERSGSRVHARHTLRYGRPLILTDAVAANTRWVMKCPTSHRFTWPAATRRSCALSMGWCVMSTSALEPSLRGDTAPVRRALVAAAGGYLRNVIRDRTSPAGYVLPRSTGSTAAGAASTLDASPVWLTWWHR